MTNAADLAERMKWLHVHGGKSNYYHEMIGGDFRIDTIKAAVLNVKLMYLVNGQCGDKTTADTMKNSFSRVG